MNATVAVSNDISHRILALLAPFSALNDQVTPLQGLASMVILGSVTYVILWLSFPLLGRMLAWVAATFTWHAMAWGLLLLVTNLGVDHTLTQAATLTCLVMLLLQEPNTPKVVKLSLRPIFHTLPTFLRSLERFFPFKESSDIDGDGSLTKQQ